MKCISIPQDLTAPVSVEEFDETSAAHPLYKQLADKIGNGCRFVEEVKCSLTQTFDVALIVDEEFLYHADDGGIQNMRATMLYPFGLGIHGNAYLVFVDRSDLLEGPTWGDMPDGMSKVLLRVMQSAWASLHPADSQPV